VGSGGSDWGDLSLIARAMTSPPLGQRSYILTGRASPGRLEVQECLAPK
jgi:hypothetical protein